MTREEAVRIIKECKEKGFKHTFYTLNEYHTALDIAIKALEQEPCDNAVSRQDVLDLAKKGILISNGNYESVCKAINELPSVNLMPCEDAISRQAVLNLINADWKYEGLEEDVSSLPPVNPQPCGDLISRKAILEEFENDQYHLEFCKEHHIERSISMEMVRIRLHDLPPVNPQKCEGAISREDAMMCLTGEIKETDTIETIIARSGRRIRKLPSVKPQEPCEDAISRQAVLNALYALCDTGETLKENPWRDNPHIDAVIETIEELPPVTPQPKEMM